MDRQRFAVIGAPLALSVGTASAVEQASGGYVGFSHWLAIGWGLGACFSLAMGIIASRQSPTLGLICTVGGAGLLIAGFIIPAIS